MPHTELLQEIRQRELALHLPEVRACPAKMHELLHESFFEFGRSGGSCDKPQALAHLPLQNSSVIIKAQGFLLDVLADDIVLLRYQSWQQSESEPIEKRSNRSSLWQRSDQSWQLRFHQGTPTAPFVIEPIAKTECN